MLNLILRMYNKINLSMSTWKNMHRSLKIKLSRQSCLKWPYTREKLPDPSTNVSTQLASIMPRACVNFVIISYVEAKNTSELIKTNDYLSKSISVEIACRIATFLNCKQSEITRNYTSHLQLPPVSSLRNFWSNL